MPETFTDVLSTQCIVYREEKKKERPEDLILHFDPFLSQMLIL